MKKLNLLLLLTFSLPSAFAEEGDSATKKLIKAKIVADNPDSVTGKLIKTEAASDALKDKSDSGMKKAVNLKLIQEAGK